MSEPVEAASLDLVSHARKDKRSSDDGDLAKDSICLTYPHDVCVYIDYYLYRQQTSKLFFHEDQNAMIGLRREAPTSTIDNIVIVSLYFALEFTKFVRLIVDVYRYLLVLAGLARCHLYTGR